jgi:AraC-like DNA-binding protein
MWSLAGTPEEASLPGIVVPDAHVEFVFHLGERWRTQRVGYPGWVLQPAAFAHATSRGALRFRPTGRVCVLAFRVSPVVATRILNRSLADLWDAPVSLESVSGLEASSLLENLRLRPPAERFLLLKQWVEERLRDWGTDEWNSQRLFNTILWRSSARSIAQVSRTLGPSERSLRRLLATHAGISPKAVQLSGRLLKACALLREQRSVEITDVATCVGFHDHAAFTHTFTDRIGLTPTQFRAEPAAFYERAQPFLAPDRDALWPESTSAQHE